MDLINKKILLASNKETISVDEYNTNKDKYKIIGIVFDNENRLAFSINEPNTYINWSKAIKWAKSYKTNGTKIGEWRLPTKEEWETAIKNMDKWFDIANSLFDFKKSYYWSSSECSEPYSWCANLKNEQVYKHFKYSGNSVRACVAF